MNTTIISIGNELLSGQTVNTNLAYLAKNLKPLGIEVSKAITIKDSKQAIFDALDAVDTKLVIFTGGLGPTHDDITKETVCEYFGLTLVEHPEILNQIQAYFKRLNRDMKPTNRKQAFFPKTATILNNDFGTAPGMIVTAQDKTIALLPGPPSELKPMSKYMIEHLKAFIEKPLIQRGYRLVGIGESDIENAMQDFYETHNEVDIAPYASLGEVVYLFTSAKEQPLGQALKSFKKKFAPYIVGEHHLSLETIVFQTLLSLNKTISFAESCTGGMLASRMVNVPDASKVFKESYVLYDNESKIKHLGLNAQILEKFGAVSEQCVYELAYQLAQKTNADITLSISGIAGPSGGTKDKPVGTVYFGLYTEGITKTDHKVFSGDRQMIRQKATSHALFLAYKALMHHED